MKKFFVLVQKEVREMLTLQTILPMVITVLIFMFIGNIVGKEIDKAKETQNLVVVDQDKTAFTKVVTDALSKSNFNVTYLEGDKTAEGIEKAKEDKIAGVIVFPVGFESNVAAMKAQKVEAYSILNNFSMTGAKDTAVIDTAVAVVNEYVSNYIVVQNIANVTPSALKVPVERKDFVIVSDKTAEVSPTQVMNFVTSQTSFIPIILFIVIIFAATMIATAIATEKENKTLETLLTTPVDRKSIVSAKMVGAGVVALFSAAIYILGFRNYMDGLSGGALSSSADGISGAINQLGLVINPLGYLVLGGSLFLGILCALALATIIGAFAEDAKSVNGLMSPLMVLIMIPYFLTLFLDINSLPTIFKGLIYIIPFSYPFMAAPNIFLGNYTPIIFGMIYQLVFFGVFVYIAGKIFSTDRIITMKLNFKKKSFFLKK